MEAQIRQEMANSKFVEGYLATQPKNLQATLQRVHNANRKTKQLTEELT